MIRKWLAIGIILLFVGIAYAPAIAQNTEKQSTSRGSWLYVGGSGPGNYTKIQDAIDNASDGDNIVVYSGTYERIIINKRLSLIGVNASGGSSPLIFGGASSDCVLVLADGCFFENFRVRNGDGGYSRNGVILESNNNTISKCVLYDTGCGLKLIVSSNNTIMNNTMTGGWNGIILEGLCNNNTLLDNFVYSHTEHEIKGGGNGNVWQNNRVVGDKTGNGFAFSGSSRCMFQGNYIASNRQMGIQMSNSENMTFINNTFIENGFVISGDSYYHLTTHVMEGNIINGKPLYYFANENNVTVPMDAGQIILANCTHCIITGVNISKADVGITLWYSSYNIISSNKVNSSLFEQGIKLVESNHNIVSKNYFSGHSIGLLVSNSNNNSIEKNIIRSNDFGISVAGSKENTIVDNQISSCRIGVEVHYSGWNTISTNNVSKCSWWGLFLWDTIYNSVENNMFSGCDLGVYTIGADNSVFSNNQFAGNGNGLTISYSVDVNILGNDFSGNDYGISISERSGCLVEKNNFFHNQVSATFSQNCIFSDTRSYWIGNYWNRSKFGPHFLQGKLILVQNSYFTFSITWFNIDWRPALRPL